jgi:hypothetical protein
VTVYVFSTWILADATPGQVDAVAGDMGGEHATRIEDDHGGRLWSRRLDFSDVIDSPWEKSVTSGVRWWGLADIPTHEYGDDRLLGILGSTQALAADLQQTTLDFMSKAGVNTEPASFSLRALLSDLSDEGVLPRSVRLRNEFGLVLVQSEDESSLRSQLADINGDVIGVTVDAMDQRMTLLDDGHVLFTEPADALGILVAIRAIEKTLQVPASAG